MGEVGSGSEAGFPAERGDEGAGRLVADVPGDHANRLARREPREIALRLLLRGLAALRMSEARGPLRLERAESLLVALGEAFATAKTLKATLNGAILAFDGKTRLTLVPEEKRRRGRPQTANAMDTGPGAKGAPAKEGNSVARLALV